MKEGIELDLKAEDSFDFRSYLIDDTDIVCLFK